MNEQLRVLLATDDSVAACAAEPWLTNGRWAGRPLVEVLTVAAPALASSQWLARVRSSGIRSTVGRFEEAEQKRATEVAESVAERLRASGLETTAQVRSGEPAVEILAHAAKHRPDALLIGPRGRSELSTALLGTVSQQVLAHAEVPVLVARRGPMPIGSLPDTLVLLVDGSLGAMAALHWLRRAGWLRDTKVIVMGLLGMPSGLQADTGSLSDEINAGLRAAANEALADLAEDARPDARAVTVEVTAGHPLQVSLRAESQHLADLLVIARRKPRPGDQPLADKLARYANTSVLVVPVGG
jgi:nucleotide-binding universal stress UspA family protein